MEAVSQNSRHLPAPTDTFGGLAFFLDALWIDFFFLDECGAGAGWGLSIEP